MLQVEKNMQFFLLVFIVLVAAFSITNTLITTVIQKTKEIGLLKAMGAGSGTVMRIFILQGFFVGVIGTVSGIILGALVVKYRMVILLSMRTITGQEIFPPENLLFQRTPRPDHHDGYFLDRDHLRSAVHFRRCDTGVARGKTGSVEGVAL